MPQHPIQNFAQFVNDLEWHAHNTDIFFDRAFLRLLGRSFQLNDLAINAYRNNEYIGSEVYGRISPLVTPYQQGFYKQDFLSRYVTNNIKSLVFDNSSAIVCNTQFDATYEQQLYFDFLGSVNLAYAAVLPICEEFRLVIYKSPDKGDFTDSELGLFNSLLSVTRSKWNSFVSAKDTDRSSCIMERLLDCMGVGYVILNDDMQLMSHNANSAQYLNALFQTTSACAIPMLLDRLQGCVELKYENYHISLSSYTEVNGFGDIKTYRYISIRHAAAAAAPGGSALRFDLLTARELEVLDYFVKGYEYPEISKALFISEGTLKTHLKNIYRKLNVSNQRRLVYEYGAYTSNL